MAHKDTVKLRKLVGSRIAQMRDAREMTQPQLADSIGKSLGTIKNLEIGNTSSSFEVFVALARFFGIGVDRLFPSHYPQNELTESQREMIDRLQAIALQMGDEDVETLILVAEALSRRRKK